MHSDFTALFYYEEGSLSWQRILPCLVPCHIFTGEFHGNILTNPYFPGFMSGEIFIASEANFIMTINCGRCRLSLSLSLLFFIETIQMQEIVRAKITAGFSLVQSRAPRFQWPLKLPAKQHTVVDRMCQHYAHRWPIEFSCIVSDRSGIQLFSPLFL